MIPRRFFWLFDSFILICAFLSAYHVAPALQTFVTPGGSLSSSWLQQHLAPPATSGPFPPITEFVWIMLAMLPGTVLFLELFGCYSRRRPSVIHTIGCAIPAPFLSLSLIALALVATKAIYWSRLVFFLFGGFSAVYLVIFRVTLVLYHSRKRSAGLYAHNVLIVGTGKALTCLGRLMLAPAVQAEYSLLGYLKAFDGQADIELPSVHCFGSLAQLGDLAVHRPIHEVIIASSAHDASSLAKVVKDCDYFRISLRIIPETLLINPPRDLASPKHDDPLQLPAVILRPHVASTDALFVKRVFDILISSVALVLLFPLFAAIATAIKLTTPKLSVFYKWRVVGRNGVEFTGHKFTTMVADADDRKGDLMKYNEMTGPVFKIAEDPRVTRFGRFLRKYSLNELPQLWSVLKGDMSLVGPRPAGPHELVRYEFWHKRKLSVQSGITCLWQVRGRNLVSDFDDWVRLDLEYIDNWSLWLDFKILVRTAWVVLRGTGS